MAQPLRDLLDIAAVLEEKRSAGVPERMETDPGRLYLCRRPVRRETRPLQGETGV